MRNNDVMSVEVFYRVNPQITSVTDDLRFTSAVSRLLMNRESCEKGESFRDVNDLLLPFIATIWPHITDWVHCEKSDYLK